VAAAKLNRPAAGLNEDSLHLLWLWLTSAHVVAPALVIAGIQDLSTESVEFISCLVACVRVAGVGSGTIRHGSALGAAQ